MKNFKGKPLSWWAIFGFIILLFFAIPLLAVYIDPPTWRLRAVGVGILLISMAIVKLTHIQISDMVFQQLERDMRNREAVSEVFERLFTVTEKYAAQNDRAIAGWIEAITQAKLAASQTDRLMDTTNKAISLTERVLDDTTPEGPTQEKNLEINVDDSVYLAEIKPSATLGEELASIHFDTDNLLEMISPTVTDPWKKSRPYKQERDRTIWEMRNQNYTWEQIAEKADCGVTTAREVYFNLKKR